MAVYDRIFTAVFPPPSEVDVPTPAATPVLGSSSFGDTFGSQHIIPQVAETGAAEQIKWDRAWHTATSFLTLPNEPIRTDEDEETFRPKWDRPYNNEIRKAFEYVLSENSKGRQLRKGTNTDDLIRWYFEVEVTEHYVKHLLPKLVEVWRILTIMPVCSDMY